MATSRTINYELHHLGFKTPYKCHGIGAYVHPACLEAWHSSQPCSELGHSRVSPNVNTSAMVDAHSVELLDQCTIICDVAGEIPPLQSVSGVPSHPHTRISGGGGTTIWPPGRRLRLSQICCYSGETNIMSDFRRNLLRRYQNLPFGYGTGCEVQPSVAISLVTSIISPIIPSSTASISLLSSDLSYLQSDTRDTPTPVF